MPQSSIAKPLGKILLETGLVSSEQVSAALEDQTQDSTLRIGEILAHRGCLKQETADFFAEKWPHYLSQPPQQPIGQYLKDASLLNSQQVTLILEEQTNTGGQFGEITVQKGWLSQATIDFFLKAIHDDAYSERQQSVNERSHQETYQFKKIQEQLLEHRQCDPYQLLLTYQKALSHKIPKVADHAEQLELLNLGLLIEAGDQMLVANPTYRNALDTHWVDRQLGKLRPFEHVRINLFKLQERASLPFAAIEEVFSWTGREPFLTQIICHGIYEAGEFIPADQEQEQISRIVQTQVLENWESNEAAKHFKNLIHDIRAYPDSFALLTRYQQILRHDESPAVPNDPEQEALIKLGLVVREKNRLQVANRIYAEVFNESWVVAELAQQIPAQGQQPVALAVTNSSRSSLSAETPPERKQKNRWMLNLGRVLIGLLLFGCAGTLGVIIAQRVSRNQTATRYFDQGNALFNQGQHEAAIAKYNEVLNVDGNYHQAWTNRGYALAGIGDYDQMLSSCRSATIIDPQAVYAWNCQGEALHNLKQYQDAIAAYDQAIKLDPEDPVFWINKSESFLKLENFDASLKASQTAIDHLDQIEAQPSNTSNIKNERSIAWGMRGRVFQQTGRYKKALEAYEKSLNYNPRYFAALLGKGITLNRLEQYKNAENQFLSALNQDLTRNQAAEVWFYAGLNYCKLGFLGKAIEAYSNALSLNPNFEAAQIAKQQYCS